MEYIKGTPEGDAYLQGVAAGMAVALRNTAEQLEKQADQLDKQAAKQQSGKKKGPAIKAALVRGV